MRRLLLLLAGCGRIGFEPAGDGASLAPDTPFGTPQPLAVLNSPDSEDDPSMTDDGLELFFASNRVTGREMLWHTTRPTTTDEWTAPVFVDELNAGGNVNNPKVMGDGLVIYFTSNNRTPAVGGADLWCATRPDRGSPWNAPVPLTELETADNEYEPWVLGDQRTIFFTFNDGSDPNLFRATRPTSTDPFGPPVPMSELASTEYDGGLWVDASERVAMFHRDLDAGAERTVFRAFRDSTGVPFDAPAPIIEIDIPGGREEDAWQSADGHTLLFSSDAGGDYNIFIATR